MLTAAVLPLLLSACAACLALAAWHDFRERRIPNSLPAALACLYPAVFALGLAPLPWWSGLAVGAVVFALGAAAFAGGVLGGGDVKLAAAVGLWAGPEQIVETLAVIALAGGVLAGLVLAAPRIERLGLAVGMPLAGTRPEGVPYGVAIAAGGLWTGYRLLAA